MIVHLIDGTYELFRHFYGLRRFTHVRGDASRGAVVKGSASRGVDRPYGAVVGVLQTVLQIIESENSHRLGARRGEHLRILCGRHGRLYNRTPRHSEAATDFTRELRRLRRLSR